MKILMFMFMFAKEKETEHVISASKKMKFIFGLAERGGVEFSPPSSLGCKGFGS
jgi:hypothetical protein